MSDAYAVRATTTRDAAAVSALLAASYGPSMRAAYDAAVLAAALPLMTRGNAALLASGTYYVATTPEGRPLGCGGWTPARPGSGEVTEGLGHIRHFATDPAWSRQGVGRAIYETCVTAARASGIARFECYASLNAEPFYAALGFVPMEHIDVAMAPGVAFPAVRMSAGL